jgi:hypothetical protein
MANTTPDDWSEYMGHQRLEDAAFALPKRQGFSRTLRNEPLTLTFDIEHPGELGAGLRPYSEQVTVTVDSGDPGGSPDEFQEHIQQSLSDWFDGAAVGLRPKNLRPNRYPTALKGKIVYVSVPED